MHCTMGLLVCAAIALVTVSCARISQSRSANPPKITVVDVLDDTAPDRYEPIAVFDFTDPRETSGPGRITAKIVRSGLVASDVAIVDHATLQQLLGERQRPLWYGEEAPIIDERAAITIGKLAGARTVIVGAVQEWNRYYMDFYHITSVSLTLRMVDVATGLTLFDAKGQYTRPVVGGDPDKMANALLENIRNRLGVALGLAGTGVVGVTWELSTKGQVRAAVVTHVAKGLPAEQAGLKVGDHILTCNASLGATWETYKQSLRACRVKVGQVLTLDVARGQDRLSVGLVAMDRKRTILERTTDR